MTKFVDGVDSQLNLKLGSLCFTNQDGNGNKNVTKPKGLVFSFMYLRSWLRALSEPPNMPANSKSIHSVVIKLILCATRAILFTLVTITRCQSQNVKITSDPPKCPFTWIPPL